MKHSIIDHLKGKCHEAEKSHDQLKLDLYRIKLDLGSSQREVKSLNLINEGLQKELITEKGAFDYRVLELEKMYKEKLDALSAKPAEEKPKEAEDLKEKFESHKGRILPIREVTEDTGWPKPKRKKQWDGPRYPREMKATTKFPKES